MIKTNHIITSFAVAALCLTTSCNSTGEENEADVVVMGCGSGEGCTCGDGCSCTEGNRCSDNCKCDRYVPDPAVAFEEHIGPLAIDDFKDDNHSKTYSFVIKTACAPKGKLKYYIADRSTGAQHAIEADKGRIKNVAPASKPAEAYVVTVYDIVDGAVVDSASIEVAGVKEFPEKLSSRPTAAQIKTLIDDILASGDITVLTDSPLCVTDPEVSVASDPNVKYLSDLVGIYSFGGFTEYTIKTMTFDDTNRVCSLSLSIK